MHLWAYPPLLGCLHIYMQKHFFTISRHNIVLAMRNSKFDFTLKCPICRGRRNESCHILKYIVDFGFRKLLLSTLSGGTYITGPVICSRCRRRLSHRSASDTPAEIIQHHYHFYSHRWSQVSPPSYQVELPGTPILQQPASAEIGPRE